MIDLKATLDHLRQRSTAIYALGISLLASNFLIQYTILLRSYDCGSICLNV